MTFGKTTGTDLVNHPPHYTQHPSGVECIVIVEHFVYNIGAAIKYLWRAGLKGDALEDLHKARWYINREIGRRENTDRQTGRHSSGNGDEPDDGSDPGC